MTTCQCNRNNLQKTKSSTPTKTLQIQDPLNNRKRRKGNNFYLLRLPETEKGGRSDDFSPTTSRSHRQLGGPREHLNTPPSAQSAPYTHKVVCEIRMFQTE
ncbi:hypothetical protein JTE90_002754 [Oedothorax gibbosus]|uniref:Uncharacterized protein n=1 Tax=Oedothorax gibbosus TaxID=931172 RepID=A0AAV6UNR1_9ARAC|nr:hypothetical protein JTE90_002754 [Oedothorax gibbosus]